MTPEQGEPCCAHCGSGYVQQPGDLCNACEWEAWLAWTEGRAAEPGDKPSKEA